MAYGQTGSGKTFTMQGKWYLMCLILSVLFCPLLVKEFLSIFDYFWIKHFILLCTPKVSTGLLFPWLCIMSNCIITICTMAYSWLPLSKLLPIFHPSPYTWYWLMRVQLIWAWTLTNFDDLCANLLYHHFFNKPRYTRSRFIS